MIKIIKNFIKLVNILLNSKILNRPDFSEKKIFLQGKINYELNKEKKIINDLSDVEFSVFSQFGEDGIINWIIDKLDSIPKIFIEIGTQDYWESNTRFLLKLKNWKGYLIEANIDDVKKIKTQSIYWQNDIKVIHKFIDKDNILSTLNKNVAEKEIGLISLDIDGNDYWILEKIENIKPYIFVCEYNPIFGDLNLISTLYDPFFDRTKKHYSNMYFGCSIKALIDLMDKKHYTFLGSNSKGMNAFFIRNDLIENFRISIRNKKIFKPTIREARDEKGRLNFKTVSENFELIKNLDVIDLTDYSKKKLSDFKKIFS
ncbi:hypothetical protein OAL74_02035 [Candidatus Pelagibacter sp.]|nr:hypothetical protein [Candidatus Pelagibacter sp.]